MVMTYERDYDDEVYEDEYYDDNYEEELVDEDELIDEDEFEEEDEEEEQDEDEEDEDAVAARESQRRIEVSYACEDCDYRWEDVIVKRKGALDDYDEEHDIICPMCGSVNISII